MSVRDARDGPWLDDDRTHARLERTWTTPPGLRGWFSTVDHKMIGRRYVATAFVFFLLAGLEAAVMRPQLARPENGVVGPDLYNQLFSMHGTTMMFLFAVPVMDAMAVYLVPLMVGTRAIAFPRLNAFSYWIFVAGGAMLYTGFALGIGADTGWFSYAPLAGPEYAPGKRVDFWAQMVTFTEIAALAVAVGIVVTVFKLKAPGMTLARLPVFCWSMLVTSVMVIFAMPAVMLASTFLIMDRLVSTHIFNPAEGGQPLLWQHLFWFFGHPEVYIIFIPVTGMVPEIVATFARRPVFGYPAIVLSLVATGFLGFGLWVHHMFATGLPQLSDSFFTAASMMIAIPSGIQIFCWIATLWGGRPMYRTPLLFVIAFIVTFLLGGVSGVILASVPLDLQVHDTYFVVAHFHYVLIGEAVFPLFGAVYYWFPKFTGRMLSERAGRWNVALFFLGFHMAFFPMHLLGIWGMTRRVYTYPAGLGWEGANLLSSLGVAVIAACVLVFLGNVAWSLRRGRAAADNPWDAAGLEWATTFPPPSFNFASTPVVRSREPLWTEDGPLPVVGGLRLDMREQLMTSVVDAVPETREPSPEPSLWPFVTALATTALLVGSISTPWAVVWVSLPVTAALIGWFWPKGGSDEREEARVGGA